MIKFKKITYIIILSLYFSVGSNAALQDALFATIGNKAITRADIVNEIKTILILNGENFSQENANNLEAAAIKANIQRTLKQIEIEKYETLKFNKADVNSELNRLASKANVDLDTLKNIFAANGIEFSSIEKHIETELLWNSLIFKIYNDRLTIDVDEVNEQLKLIQKQEKIKEYLISEIIIEPVPNSEINSKISEIKNEIKSVGFKQTAMNFSISESSINGGDLGWVNENLISKEFKKTIRETTVGQVSKPIILPEGILLFEVRDVKELEQFSSLEEAKNQIINSEKQKILNMYSLSHYDNLKRSVTIDYYK
jgi:peptidyl-prolyl cis-trans isomerase SurA